MTKRKGYGFNDLVRIRLREILAARSWSVSRFATRYVDKYAELYSRMEAPSTSTARKLIEDESHIVSEREAIVLDDIFQQEFYRMWLDEQKRILLEKSEAYARTFEDFIPQQDKTEIDSEVLFRSRISNMNKFSDKLTVDDIAGIIHRYVNIQSTQPLLIFSVSDIMFESVLRNTLPETDIISSKDLIEGRYDDFSDLICSISHQIDEIEYDKLAVVARRITNEGKKVIVGIVIKFWEDIYKLATKYGRNAVVLCLPWSGFTTNTWLNTPDLGKLTFKNEKSIQKCLKNRTEWPSLFKEMVSACIESAWVRWPGLSSDGDWMLFLNKLYDTLYTDNNECDSEEALRHLIARGMPANWLLPTCNKLSLLKAISVFNRWKEDKNAEVVESVKNCKYELLLLSGNVPEKDEAEWIKWFDNQYNFCQVDFEYDALLDVAMAIERRSRLSNKK